MSLTAQQLQTRMTGIGGSDAAAAIGISKWKTPFALYLEKRGEAAPVTETEPMRWGTLLEPLVRQEYAERTGRVVRLPTDTLRHPRHEFMLAHPDGVTDDRRLYEGKTARTAEGWGEPGTDEIPQEYLIQVQHNMIVTALEVADIGVLIGGNDFRLYEVPADRELQELLIEYEAEFWRRVRDGDPPAALTSEDVRRRFRSSRPGSVEASDDLVAIVERLAGLRANAAGLEDGIEAAEIAIKAAIGEHEALTHQGRILATWKSAKPAQRFDSTAFRAAEPALYEKYLKTGEPSRRFLLKI